MTLKALTRILTAVFLISLASCADKYNGLDDWESGKTEVPGMKPRYIWIDAASNFPDFANSIGNITRDLELAKNAGFTDIVVDVRPMTGDILYKSDLCEQVRTANAWVGNSKITIQRTATWDYLQAFIDEGHKLKLRVHAGFNVMVGGHATGGEDNTPAGLLYRDSSKKEWATYRYNNGSPKNVMDLDDDEKFFNPAHPEVQKYLCDLLADLARYDLDGIVLDRGRYNDLYSDFSPVSRAQFEEYLGEPLKEFPGAILPQGTTNTTLAAGFGDLTRKWLEYRAKTIYDFMTKAREAVKAVNPDLLFGVYVGGWYNSYYNTGANWASKSYDHTVRPNSAWCGSEYRNYGYAALMDHILIGAYADPLHVKGSTEWTMEGFCIQAKAKIGNDCPLVIGGPDVDWRWTGYGAKYTRDEILSAITSSVPACINACDGYFLFDMIHLKMDPEKWTAAAQGISIYTDEWIRLYGQPAK